MAQSEGPASPNAKETSFPMSGNPRIPSTFEDKVQELVTSSVSDVIQEMRGDMVQSLHNLSKVLMMLCEIAYYETPRESRSLSSGKKSSSDDASGLDLGSSESNSGPSPASQSPQIIADSLLRALNIRSGNAQVCASSLPHTNRRAAPRAGGDKLSPIESIGSQSSPCLADQRSRGQRSESEHFSVDDQELVGNERQAEESAHAETKFGKSSGVVDSDAKADSVPEVDSADNSLRSADRNSSGSLSFQEFQNSKANRENHMPCSLSEMEDESFLFSMVRLQQRGTAKKSRNKKKTPSKTLSKIVPDESLDDIPESGALPDGVHRAKETREVVRAMKYGLGEESDIAERRKGELRAGRSTTPRSLDKLFSENAQNIIDDYTGLQSDISAGKSEWKPRIDSWGDAFYNSRPVLALQEFPEYCLVASGIAQRGNGLLSRGYVKTVSLIRLGLAAFLVYEQCAMAVESTQVFYTSFIPALLAFGAFVSMSCMWEGNSKALFGGRCDAIKMYATEHCFLRAWRTRSFHYFCGVSLFAVGQAVLMLLPVPGGISEDCVDAGLRDFPLAMLAAHVFVVASMAMLAFVHLRMCAGLQLMVDCFCEDFKMGMGAMRAASQWNTIHGLMHKTTNTIGTSFLAQISTFAAALVLGGADVLLGNLHMSRDCVTPWLLNCLIPSVLGFFVLFMGLVEAGRLTLKCSRVAGFIITERYEDACAQTEAARNQRQYLANFIHKTSRGFLIHGVQVNTFVAFKLGWALVTVTFAIWARSRSF